MFWSRVHIGKLILRSHRAHQNKFTNIFWKGPVHTWFLYGNLPEKTVCVKVTIDFPEKNTIEYVGVLERKEIHTGLEHLEGEQIMKIFMLQ